MCKISGLDSIDEIMKYTHFWNWNPDWTIARDGYQKFPNSYSILSPFAYTYLEELIRSTTSEYGIEVVNEEGKLKKRKVGISLINLAINENRNKNSEYLSLLKSIKKYYKLSKTTDSGNNRNSVAHGFIHPKFWSKESFEKLLYDIANISRFANFQ